MNETKRGGPGKGQGRKRIKPGEPSVSFMARLAQSQHAKLIRLGGAAWIRDRIEEAKND